MKLLLCEIKSDDTLVVLEKHDTDEDVKRSCSWSDKYANKNLVLIQCREVKVETTNYGNDIEVEIS